MNIFPRISKWSLVLGTACVIGFLWNGDRPPTSGH
jgi:hypothetical protein